MEEYFPAPWYLDKVIHLHLNRFSCGSTKQATAGDILGEKRTKNGNILLNEFMFKFEEISHLFWAVDRCQYPGQIIFEMVNGQTGCNLFMCGDQINLDVRWHYPENKNI